MDDTRKIKEEIDEKEKSEKDIILLEIVNTIRLTTLSAILGVVIGISVRPTEGLLVIVLPVVGIIIFLSGIIALMLIITIFRPKSMNKYIIQIVKVILSLVIFLFILSMASEINRRYYG